jgi:hypothetical protein
MKVALIQLWFGPLPEYFNYHLETTKNIDLIDFYFFTDQDLDIKQDNFFHHKIDKGYVTDYLSKKLNHEIKVSSDKKFCDVKAALSDLFYIYIKDYDYVGCYDIDTLFGDVNKFLTPLLDHYDFISIGEKTFYNRLSGPFLIYRNTEELRTLYKVPEFIECMNSSDVMLFEETILNRIVSQRYSKYIISQTNVESNSGKIIYEASWNGGQLYCDNNEIFIHHFYRKKNTLFGKIGNTIYTKYKKTILDDFMWVIHFSQNYEKYAPQLLESIHNYSNRKCVIYTINYDSPLKFEYQYISDQFIFIRLDLQPGKLDLNGRDPVIMNSKPLIPLDVLERFPDKKFIHIDTDISLTVNSDKISRHFDQLENYPLINSHIHDVIYLCGFVEDGGFTSSLHTLLDLMGIEPNIPLPRRKTNIVVFDKNSKWFFLEQIEIYDKFKNHEDPIILAYHDEDSTNALLTKYQLYKSLPLVDIEETYDLSLDVLHNYSYSLTPISEHVVLPKNLNEILFFHGFKTKEDFELIKMNYGKKTLTHDDIDIYYKNDTLFIERNNFMVDKKFERIVDLVIYTKEYEEIFNFSNQDIFNVNLFFINNFELQPNIYLLEIIESESRKVIYHNNFQI